MPDLKNILSKKTIIFTLIFFLGVLAVVQSGAVKLFKLSSPKTSQIPQSFPIEEKEELEIEEETPLTQKELTNDTIDTLYNTPGCCTDFYSPAAFHDTVAFSTISSDLIPIT